MQPCLGSTTLCYTHTGTFTVQCEVMTWFHVDLAASAVTVNHPQLELELRVDSDSSLNKKPPQSQ